MFSHPLRALIAGGFATLAAVALSALPAAADAPSTWDATEVSGFQFLLVLLIIPGALALLIALLSSLSGWRKGEAYVPGQAWRSESEWFGGPRKGVTAADEADPRAIESGDRGGSSGSW